MILIELYLIKVVVTNLARSTAIYAALSDLET